MGALRLAGWWSAGRRELAAVARLAAPVVVVQLGLMLMGVADTVMLGRISPAALAAAALGNVYSFSLLVGAQGLLMALDPLVAQAYGASDRAGVGRHLARACALSLLLSVPLGILMWDARPVLGALHQQPELFADANGYIRAVSLGNPALLLFVVLRQTLQAMSRVRPAVVAVVIGNLVNLLCNWALIFGHLGLPRLEVVGAAWATAISRWSLLLVIWLAARRALAPYWTGLDGEAFRLRSQAQLLRLGLPIAAHMLLEMLVFVTTGLVIGAIGVREFAAHQIALNLASLSFMVPLGIGAAASTRVGNAVGAGDSDAARRAAATSLVLGVGVMAGFALLFGFGGHLLAAFYTRDPAVRALAASLLAVAAAFQVFDGTQVVSLGVLRGAADTRVPAAFALLGFWLLGLPVGLGLALGAGMGPRGLWWGLTSGLAIVAVLLVLRVRRRFRGRVERVETGAVPVLPV